MALFSSVISAGAVCNSTLPLWSVILEIKKG
jgi:hypothetical protein